MTEPKSRPQVPDSAMTGDALESSQTPDIIDTEQDDYAQKCGYRNIDEYLDDPRRKA